MAPKRMSILGVGLLGGSIGLAARNTVKDCEIIGYGHNPSTLRDALQLGAIHKAADSAAAAVRGSDLVVLCTPVGILHDLLRTIAPALPPGALVTDVGSTKRSVVAAAAAVLPAEVHFVGSHPMAGSEKRGVRHASADLFQGATCITTPIPRTNPGALEKIESFWRTLGMQIVRLSPADHDERLADISHLPHALAAALVALQDEASLPLAGKGFLDTTRIAGGDGGLWRDIFLDNRDNLTDSIRRLRDQLDRLVAQLEAGDAEAVKSWLDTAAARREAMVGPKPRTGP
jgi:prephenate dehydrogenase